MGLGSSSQCTMESLSVLFLVLLLLLVLLLFLALLLVHRRKGQG
ncbi:MAG: hypothetical protein ACYTFG_13735 [Planctomycetota bacterium]